MTVSAELARPVTWLPYAKTEDVGAAMKRDPEFMALLEKGREARLQGRTRPLGEVMKDFGLG